MLSLNMDNIKGCFYNILGKLPLPEEIKDTSEKKLLHISDTPSCFYPCLQRFLDSLKPDIIVHTGDLADDIKLEDCLGRLSHYNKVVGHFLDILENTPAEEIYIVPGNHDAVTVISHHSKRSVLKSNGSTLDIAGQKVGVSHEIEGLPEETKYNLFGHNFSSAHPGERMGRIFLNGLKNVNVVLLPSWKIFNLSYPMGTNDARQMNGFFRTL